MVLLDLSALLLSDVSVERKDLKVFIPISL
jgi:hypothetical protein